MTFQIRGIAIYSHEGEKRDIRFRLGCLNIVSGGSKTGKSALAEIVDWCWGREHCNVPSGEIRRSVSWFAVIFDRDGEGILVARRNPPVGETRSDDIYLERNLSWFPDDVERFSKNIGPDALRVQLSRLLGISENLHVPEPSATRRPLEATAGQAILFCLQPQDEIASRRVLFHRQSEEYIPQHIRDVLPYFLGAIDEDAFLRQKRLDDARRRLRQLTREYSEARALAAETSSTAQRLLGDARRARLLPPGPVPEDASELRVLLARATTVAPISLSDSGEPVADLAELEERRRHLRVDLESARERIDEIKRLLGEVSGFEAEAMEQQARLASMQLLPSVPPSHASCPLCEAPLAAPVPGVDDLIRSLETVSGQLTSVRRDNPRLQGLLAGLETTRRTTEAELRSVAADIQARMAENERLRIQQDHLVERARVSGRIAFYLENVGVLARDALPTELARCRAEVEELERGLDPETTAEKVETSLALISKYLTEYAGYLQLEHGQHSVRLDRKNLTVVADTPDGPLTLAQIGSGENWVGYHVAAHLGLHKLFRIRNRPVPAFLILDQPSQAHYPRERDVGEVRGDDDEDQIAVSRLFKLLDDFSREPEISSRMQVIVMDHFELLQEWFREAIVERWREGVKLVPVPWLNNG